MAYHHCDGCRFCPLAYPSKGLVGDAVNRIPIADYEWRGRCGLGHEVGMTWWWYEQKTYLFRTPHWVSKANPLMYTRNVCQDWEEPYRGPRVSRYERLPVI